MSSGGSSKPVELLPLYKTLHGALENTGSKGGVSISKWNLLIAYLVIGLLFVVIAPEQSDYNWSLLFLTAPVWLPIFVGRFALLRFLQMKRMAFNSGKKFVLLELRIPRDTAKTPQAMETIFSNLHLGPGESSWHKKYWVGGVRPWWSFELVSIEGTVHLYVWTRDDMRRAVETYFYAQYPDIEIIEAADYSRLRDAASPPYKMSAYEYKHSKEDAFPIRTYVDYKLDKPPGKDEEQVNPLAQVLELLGSAGPGEQIWIQIMIRTTKSEKWRGKVNGKGKPYTWKDEGNEKVAEIKKGYTDDKGNITATENQKDLVKAVERNLSKQGFDVGIRAIYSAPKDKHSGSVGGYIANIFKPFSSELLNGIEGAPGIWSNAFPDYPWADPGGKKEAAMMPEALELYRRRAYFYPPYRASWMIMSTEELATLFHIPASSVRTPTIPRIQSTTGAAPSNLPF